LRITMPNRTSPPIRTARRKSAHVDYYTLRTIIVARHDGRIVGIARAITDFSYCCYLSDLAVAGDYQRQGIGKRLIEETHRAAGEQTTLSLISAPAAESYYPKIGMKTYPCFGIPRSR